MSVECFEMLRILESKVLDVCEGVEMEQFCWKQTKTNEDGLTFPEPEGIWELCFLDLAMHGHSSAGSYDSHDGWGAHTSSVEVSEASLPAPPSWLPHPCLTTTLKASGNYPGRFFISFD